MNFKLLPFLFLLSSSEILIAMQKAHSGGMMKNDLGQRFLRATEQGSKDLVTTLLEEGAELQTVNTQKQTALHLATLGGHTALVKLFLLKGAEVDPVDSAGCTPLHYAAIKGLSGCGEALIAKSANLLAKDPLGYIPFHRAILEGNATFLKMLLKHDMYNQLNARDDQETAALHLAALCGHVNTFKVVYNAALSANPINSLMMTPLHCAASVGNHEFIRLMGERAIMTAQSKDGRTALHYAVSRPTEDHTQTVEELIRLQVPLDVKDRSEKKETALHSALRRGGLTQAELLLAAGADATLLNGDKHSASDLIVPALLTKNEEKLSGDTVNDLSKALALAKSLQLTAMSALLQEMYDAETSKKRKRRSTSSQRDLKKLNSKEDEE